MFREGILDMELVYNDDFNLYLFINDKTIMLQVLHLNVN